MKILRCNRIVSASLLIFVFACTGPRISPTITNAPVENVTEAEKIPALPPNVIYHNGTIITMDDKRPHAQAIAIADERILAVGANEEILLLQDSSTQVIDLQGKTVLPGFIDSHQHRIGDRTVGGYEDVEAVIQLAIGQGWTSIDELYVNEERLNELRTLDAEGKLRLRVNAYLPLHSPEGDSFGNWYQAYQAGFEYSPYLRLAGVKIYMDHGWGRGELLWTQGELDQMVLEAHRLNWQIAAHTVGEPAHTMLINSLEKALGGVADPHYRHRIEHIIVISDNDMQRMKQLGILGSIQLNGPASWVEWPDWDSGVTPDMYPHIARYRDLIESGVFIVGSSDWPWGWPPIEPGYGSPMLLLYQAVTRTGSNRRSPKEWMLGQSLTMEEAVRSLTINGAYATFEEDKKGSLESGKLADIVIPSENPLTVPIEEVPDIQILMSMIGGKFEYCAVGQAALCPTQHK